MIPALLVADQLSVGRGDRVLIASLDLQLRPGELLHLRGRNGAGKTSLLEVLAGLRPPQSGALSGAGAAGPHWVGHRNGLHPSLSVIENLRFWCSLHGAAENLIVPSLQRFGLERLRYRMSRTLSAGQKRRAALARLLLAPRPLWLLDEPLSALDADGLQCFSEVLLQHLDGGGAAIVTSHQPLPVPAGRVRDLELA